MNENEIIKESISEIKQILGIIKSEISEIEGKIQTKKEIKEDQLEENIRVSVLNTQKGYLEFYKKIIEFIYEKLAQPAPDEDFFFYLPLLRTLIEIYAYLLYLSFQEENKQMTLVVIKILSTIAKIDDSGKNVKDIILKYNENYEKFRLFIEKEKLTIPSDMNLLSNTWLKKSGYDYPPVAEMLKDQWIKESSPQMSTNINNKTGKPYYVYSLLSNYVHGNILNKEYYGNEKFWIISETLIVSCQVSELVSIKILNSSKRKEISGWIKRVNANNSHLKKIWSSRKTPIS